MSEERAAKQPDHHQTESRTSRTAAPTLDQDLAGGVPAVVGVAVGTAAPSDPGAFGRHRVALQRLPSDPLRRQFVQTLARQYGNVYVQRVLAPDRAPADARPNLAGQIEAERGGGAPLDAAARGDLEPSLGADLSRVRVHTGPTADSLARKVEAEAFTTGHDIFFRDGRHDPSTPSGKALLAHEATHTVQQDRGPVTGEEWGGGVRVSTPGDHFEREADATAAQVARRAAAATAPAGPSNAARPASATNGTGAEPAVQRASATAEAPVSRSSLPPTGAHANGHELAAKETPSETETAADGTGIGDDDGGPRVALAHRIVQLKRPATGLGEGVLAREAGMPDIQRICTVCAEESVQRSPAVDLAAIGLAPPAARSDREADGEERASVQRSTGPAIQRLSLTDGFATIVEQISPGLAQLIRSGPLSLLIDKIKSGIQSWLGGVMGAVNIGPIISALQSSITGAFSTVMGVLTGDPAGCASFAGTIDALGKLGQAFMDNPAVQQLQAAFSTVKGVFEKVNELVVAPALDALMSIAGGIFDQVKALASTIWGWAGEVRDYLGAAWDWVKEQLGLGGDGEDGILAWLKSNAAAAWSQIKETLAPVMGPLKTVLSTLLIFSPVGPTILIVKYVPPLVEAVQWLWAHRSDPNIVESAHQQMGHTILPKILSTVQGFGQAVKSAATEIVNKAVEVGESVLSLLGAIGGVPLLSMARGLVETVSNGLQQLVTWGREAFQTAADAIVKLFEKVKEALAPYIEVLSSLAMAIVNPAAIPVILAGWAWRKLDDCYKPPIINFLLNIIIRLLRAAPNLPMMGPLWPLLKTGVIAFVEGVKGKDDKTKIALTNKFAKIMSGASPAFIIGFVKGFLIGIWEGLTDPFVLIYNILKGIGSVQTWLQDAATQALSPTPAAATAGPAGASGPVPASSRQALAQRVRQMAGELEPPVQTVTTGFMPAIQEVFSGGKGMSFTDLMAKLGEAWTAVEAKIREVGGTLADEACEYFLRDAADGEIGEGVGWLAGTITFEVVLAILTAGTYEALKPLQGIAKILDWTGEAFGILFKWLGKVGGWVMDGLRGLRRLFDNAGGAARRILDAIAEFGQKLLRYADELMGRVGREAAGEAGERGGRRAGGKRAGGELGEEGAEQGGRRADDAEGPPRDKTPDAERQQAKLEAQAIAAAHDLVNTPVPALLATLSALKARYRWITAFNAEPKRPGHYTIVMRATTIDEDYSTTSGPELGPSGKRWDDPTLTKDEFVRDYQARFPDSSLDDAELGRLYDDGMRLNPESGRLKSPVRPIEPSGPVDLPGPGHPKYEQWSGHQLGDTSKLPCFPSGTKVKTPEGDQVIERLATGDRVFAYDFEAKSVVVRPVTALHKNWTPFITVVSTNRERLSSTRSHPYWAESEGAWIPAVELRTGMVLRLLDGQFSTVQSVDTYAAEEGTFNVEVDRQHNYFVGTSGALVHNGADRPSKYADTTRYPNTDIYVVRDVNTGDVIYVGQTVQGVDVRLGSHVNNPKSALFIPANDPRRLDPNFPRSVYGIQAVQSSPPKGWTEYDAAVWEQHYIDQHGGLQKLRNRQLGIDPDKYILYHDLHNPCL